MKHEENLDLVEYLSATIGLAGGEIVGKTRLQKIAYLLKAKGLGFLALDFDYHNYGPFSAELAFAADDAVALGLIETEERLGYHAVPYTVFSATEKAPTFAESPVVRSRKLALRAMDGYSAIVLELAATAVYLQNNGYGNGQWKEVKKRKALKATQPRVEAAKQLVSELNL